MSSARRGISLLTCCLALLFAGVSAQPTNSSTFSSSPSSRRSSSPSSRRSLSPVSSTTNRASATIRTSASARATGGTLPATRSATSSATATASVGSALLRAALALKLASPPSGALAAALRCDVANAVLAGNRGNNTNATSVTFSSLTLRNGTLVSPSALAAANAVLGLCAPVCNASTPGDGLVLCSAPAVLPLPAPSDMPSDVTAATLDWPATFYGSSKAVSPARTAVNISQAAFSFLQAAVAGGSGGWPATAANSSNFSSLSLNVISVYLAPPATSATPSPSARASSTNSTAPPPSSSASAPLLSPGAIAGIVIGVISGVVLIACAIVLMHALTRRAERRLSKPLPGSIVDHELADVLFAAKAPTPAPTLANAIVSGASTISASARTLVRSASSAALRVTTNPALDKNMLGAGAGLNKVGGSGVITTMSPLAVAAGDAATPAQQSSLLDTARRLTFSSAQPMPLSSAPPEGSV